MGLVLLLIIFLHEEKFDRHNQHLTTSTFLLHSYLFTSHNLMCLESEAHFPLFYDESNRFCLCIKMKNTSKIFCIVW